MRMLRLALIALALCAATLQLSCDKINGAMKKVEGKVAGQVLNKAGRGHGYVSVELVPADTTSGNETMNTLAEESGNFMIEDVPPGKYTLHVKDAGGNEMPSDTPAVSVGPGRTMTQNVILNE